MLQSKIQILFVEDDEVIRNAARVALERQGFSTALAASGADACRMLECGTACFQAIVVDWAAPGMAGGTLLEKRKAAPSAALVVSSDCPGVNDGGPPAREGGGQSDEALHSLPASGGCQGRTPLTAPNLAAA